MLQSLATFNQNIKFIKALFFCTGCIEQNSTGNTERNKEMKSLATLLNT